MISMTPETQSVLDMLLKLPQDQRLAVAQALWESLDDSAMQPDVEDEEAFLEELMRRDAEMEAGIVSPLTHEELMASVRRDLECDSPTPDSETNSWLSSTQPPGSSRPTAPQWPSGGRMCGSSGSNGFLTVSTIASSATPHACSPSSICTATRTMASTGLE
jgi:putative addiction module component (TIGR02574 family)